MSNITHLREVTTASHAIFTRKKSHFAIVAVFNPLGKRIRYRERERVKEGGGGERGMCKRVFLHI